VYLIDSFSPGLERNLSSMVQVFVDAFVGSACREAMSDFIEVPEAMDDASNASDEELRRVKKALYDAFEENGANTSDLVAITAGKTLILDGEFDIEFIARAVIKAVKGK
jgi:hypothetical protein